MDEQQKRIIEIGGIKMEVDLRDCKVVEHYKVGDQIKVLMKKYSDYKSFPGVIIGFDNFKNLPSILIAYLEMDYSGANVHFLTFHEQLEDVEICPLNELDKYFDKSEAMEQLDKKIDKAKDEVKDLEMKKKYFESTFAKYFDGLKV